MSDGHYIVIMCNHCDVLSGALLTKHDDPRAIASAQRDMSLHCVLRHPDSDEAMAAVLARK